MPIAARHAIQAHLDAIVYRLLAQGEPREDVARALCFALGMSTAAAGRLVEDVQRRHLA